MNEDGRLEPDDDLLRCIMSADCTCSCKHGKHQRRCSLSLSGLVLYKKDYTRQKKILSGIGSIHAEVTARGTGSVGNLREKQHNINDRSKSFCLLNSQALESCLSLNDLKGGLVGHP